MLHYSGLSLGVSLTVRDIGSSSRRVTRLVAFWPNILVSTGVLASVGRRMRGRVVCIASGRVHVGHRSRVLVFAIARNRGQIKRADDAFDSPLPTRPKEPVGVCL